jgi:hypothetical protein
MRWLARKELDKTSIIFSSFESQARRSRSIERRRRLSRSAPLRRKP